MPTTIKLKNSVTTSAAPTTLVQGEVAANITDKKLWIGNAASGVVQILGAGATVSGTDVAYTGTLTGGTGVVNLGSGQFYKDASGNIGVGTSSPNSAAVNKALTISGTANAILELNGGATRAGYLFASTATGATILSSVPAAGILQFNTVDTERMRIDSSGNCGIGTSSPSARLDVFTSNSTMAKFTRDLATDSIFSIGADNDGTILESSGINTMRFFTSASERMRIDSSGNLLVGTTAGVGNGGRIALVFDSSTGQSGVQFKVSQSYGGSACTFFTSGNTQVGYIQIDTSSVSYNTTSDYRLKENIAPMSGALDVVQALKPVTYNWKIDGSSGQGFIAHELQAVVPDCVTGEKDAVNEDGSIKPQGIDTSFLVATLVAAIQELKAEIDLLKGK